ncbi:MAG: CDC27 family protein, partial [Candidatus Muiribacteriota bacterium]
MNNFTRRGLFLLFCLIISLSSFGQVKEMRDIKIFENPNNVEFLISFSDSDFEYFPAAVGNLLRLDFPNTRFVKGEISESIYRGTIMFYRTEYIDNEKNSLRILITLTDPTPVRYEKIASSLKVIIPKTSTSAISEASVMDESRARLERMRAQMLFTNASEAMRLKEWEKAHQYLKDAIILDSANQDIKNALNIVQEKVMEQKVHDARLKEAFEYYTQGDYLRTIDLLVRFNEQNGKTPESTYYLGRAYFDVKDYQKAKREFEFIVKNYPAFEFISSTQQLLERADYYIANELTSESLIDFSAEGKSVTEIVSSLLYGTGYRYEIEDGITRLLTVDIRRRSLKEALDIVASAGGLEYKIENRIVKISQKRLQENFISNLGFQNMLLEDVLNAIADFMTINIILAPEIDRAKRVTFFIENSAISIDEFFDLILKSNNLAAIKYNESTYYVTDILKAKESNYQHKFPHFFNLQYISPEEALFALKSVKRFREILDFDNISVFDFDKGSKILKNQTEYVEKADREERFNTALEKLSDENVKDIEAPEKEDLVKSLINYQYNEATKSETVQNIETQSSFEKPESEGGEIDLNSYRIKISDLNASTRKVKQLFAYETRENLDLIKSFLDNIDKKRKQVMIALKVMEINSNYTDNLGISTLFDGNSSSLNVSKMRDMTQIKLESTLSFLEENKNGKLIASPTIRVLDGHSAKIDIIKEVTMKTREAKEVQVSGTVGNNVAQTGGTDWKVIDIYKEIDLGLKMEVLPVINSNGEITI